MTKYQEEFYKFAIATENFDAICDIVDNFHEFRDRIIYDFWVLIKERCEEQLKNSKGWKVYLAPFEDEVSEFTIYRAEYSGNNSDEVDIGISAFNLYSQGTYGLYVIDKPTLFNREKFMKYAKENRIAGWRYGTGFPYYKLLSEDFSDISDLKKIHPANRTSLVHQYSKGLVEAVNEFEPIIKKHILKKK